MLKWNGWGTLDQYAEAEKKYPQLLKSLEELFRVKVERNNNSVNIEDIRLKPALQGNVFNELLKVLTNDNIKIDSYSRVMHSRGRSLSDLLELRSGNLKAVPDAVVFPDTEVQIIKIIDICKKNNICVIPFGGGSSVTGGVNSVDFKGYRACIVINLSRYNSFINLDEVSMTADFESGISGPDLEKILGEKGYTLGHFPQSFEFSTLGGWVVTRGAGFMSDYYGKADEMVISIRIVTPSGVLDSEISPVVSEGPSLLDFIAGSEGTIGVVTRVKIRISRKLEKKISFSYLFKSYEDATDVFRKIRQEKIKPLMLRLSDPEETLYFRILNKKESFKERIQNTFLSFLNYNSPALMLIMSETSHQENKIKKIINIKRRIPLGKGPVNQWFVSRFSLPYLRDFLLDYNIASDTFETYVSWLDLEKVRKAVYREADAIGRKLKKKIMLMSHLSHSYEYGVCIYFTVFYIMTDKPGPAKIKEWNSIKGFFYSSIANNGGSLSHHHGLGSDHFDQTERQPRKTKFLVFGNAKKYLDPENIMNPGKLFKQK